MRKALSKKTRFEVFKRDSFKCQYCGNGAPEVILHVDHIQPVATGGLNDILNLITACIHCNAGKGARELSDDSAISKQRQQLEELNERREQIEMMVAWRQGLTDIEGQIVEAVATEYTRLFHGWTLNESGLNSARKLLKTFSLQQILDAMNVAATQYLKYENDEPTGDSISFAWLRVGGIARMSTQDEGTKQLYYIRGICRKRLSYCDDRECLDILKQARALNASTDVLMSLAREARSYTQWKNWMYEGIAILKAPPENGA